MDHTAGIPDEEIHAHNADLLRNAGAILYGRIHKRTVLKLINTKVFDGGTGVMVYEPVKNV